MKGYVYILECSNGQYYKGSTTDLAKRYQEHQIGLGANFTYKHLPLKLIYLEEYDDIETAFAPEKQLQGWSRKKVEALISNNPKILHRLAKCQNETHFKNKPIEKGE